MHRGHAKSLSVALCLITWTAVAGCHADYRWFWGRDGGKPHNPPGQAGQSGGSAGSGAAPSGGTEPQLPAARGECPKLETGEVELSDLPVRLWVGERQANQSGPILIYWHGTGSFPGEAELMLGNRAISEILAAGGVIAAPGASTGDGELVGPGPWWTGDFALADQIVACAVEQRGVDPRRVYTAGCSAGGLQAARLAYGRSSYVAAAIPNSGGLITPATLQDPSHVPAVMTTHGASGVDVVVVDYAEASARLTESIVELGGFAADCQHDGGHCGSPPAVKDAQWQFLLDHPFGVEPEPYASGLPASAPNDCQIVN